MHDMNSCLCNFFQTSTFTLLGFPRGSVGKEATCNAGDTGDSGSGRCPGGGNDNPFQYSCLGNPMDRGAWQTTVHGVAKSWTQLNDKHTKQRDKNVQNDA